jgi:hypothetical protein
LDLVGRLSNHDLTTLLERLGGCFREMLLESHRSYLPSGSHNGSSRLTLGILLNTFTGPPRALAAYDSR